MIKSFFFKIIPVATLLHDLIMVLMENVELKKKNGKYYKSSKQPNK